MRKKDGQVTLCFHLRTLLLLVLSRTCVFQIHCSSLPGVSVVCVCLFVCLIQGHYVYSWSYTNISCLTRVYFVVPFAVKGCGGCGGGGAGWHFWVVRNERQVGNFTRMVNQPEKGCNQFIAYKRWWKYWSTYGCVWRALTMILPNSCTTAVSQVSILGKCYILHATPPRSCGFRYECNIWRFSIDSPFCNIQSGEELQSCDCHGWVDRADWNLNLSLCHTGVQSSS